MSVITTSCSSLHICVPEKQREFALELCTLLFRDVVLQKHVGNKYCSFVLLTHLEGFFFCHIYWAVHSEALANDLQIQLFYRPSNEQGMNLAYSRMTFYIHSSH